MCCTVKFLSNTSQLKYRSAYSPYLIVLRLHQVGVPLSALCGPCWTGGRFQGGGKSRGGFVGDAAADSDDDAI